MFKALSLAKAVPAWAWVAAAAGVALYIVKKGGINGAAAGIAAGAVGVAGSAAAGVVLGVGDVLGLPRTGESECELAIRDGNNWKASQYCTASRFIEFQLTGIKSNINKALQQF